MYAIDIDEDGIDDSIDRDINSIDNPNTPIDEREFVCNQDDVAIHTREQNNKLFIPFGCENQETIWVFSVLKQSLLTDTDEDWVNDLIDGEITSVDQVRFICRAFDIGKFSDCVDNSDLGIFSAQRQATLIDSDRDSVRDFEDRQINTTEDQRLFVCTARDIAHPRDSVRFSCNNDSLLWVYSLAKRDYILSNRNGTLTATAGGAISDGVNITNGGLNLDSGDIKQWSERNDPSKSYKKVMTDFLPAVMFENNESMIYSLI